MAKIALEHVTYTYPDSRSRVLNNLRLSVAYICFSEKTVPAKPHCCACWPDWRSLSGGLFQLTDSLWRGLGRTGPLYSRTILSFPG